MQCTYRAYASIARARPITTKRLAMSRATAAGAGDVAVADALGAAKKIATRMAEYPVAGTFSTMTAAWAAVGRGSRQLVPLAVELPRPLQHRKVPAHSG